MNILEQGVFKRFEDGSERRNRLVVQAREAEAQLIASQLAAEGIVVLDTTKPDSLLGRLGRAISPHTKQAALFASAALAFIFTSCGDGSGRGGAESPPAPTKPIGSDSSLKSVPQQSSEQIPVLAAELTPRPISTLVGIGGGQETSTRLSPRLEAIINNPNRTAREAEIFNTVYVYPVEIHSNSLVLNRNIEAILRQEATSFLEQLYEEEIPPNQIQFFVVNASSPGIFGEVYRDLQNRGLMATTVEDVPGLREIFGTPFLLFTTEEFLTLYRNSSDFLSRLFIHEFRHIRQAIGNPNLQKDFRNPDGSFTPYAALMEAWADEGLCTTPKYQSCAWRMPTLRQILKNYQTANGLEIDSDQLINMAGKGDKIAYNLVRVWYNNARGEGSFDRLFPPYW